jgi:hypothetical protein
VPAIVFVAAQQNFLQLWDDDTAGGGMMVGLLLLLSFKAE